MATNWVSYHQLREVSLSVEVRIQTADFNVQTEIDRVRLSSPQIGAVASFVGVVRERFAMNNQVHEAQEKDRVARALYLEHYPGMTEKSIEAICATASGRWQLQGITVIHRVGRLLPQEQIVLVVTASAHRHAAFESCAFIMDFLKTDAVLWKREEKRDGAQHWVESTANDRAAAQRWQES